MSTPDHLVCFAHGKESGPWGIKITYLADIARTLGYEVMSPDYSHTHDARQRLEQLRRQAPTANRALVLVGSSMGGYVSAMACSALNPQGLMLLAPALYFPGLDQEPEGVPALCSVVHGWRDPLVPAEHSIRFATRHRAELHLLDSEHTLNDQLPILGELFRRLLERVLQTHPSVQS